MDNFCILLELAPEPHGEHECGWTHHVVSYAWAISCQFSKMIWTSIHLFVSKLLCMQVVKLLGSPIVIITRWMLIAWKQFVHLTLRCNLYKATFDWSKCKKMKTKKKICWKITQSKENLKKKLIGYYFKDNTKYKYSSHNSHSSIIHIKHIHSQ